MDPIKAENSIVHVSIFSNPVGVVDSIGSNGQVRFKIKSNRILFALADDALVFGTHDGAFSATSECCTYLDVDRLRNRI